MTHSRRCPNPAFKPRVNIQTAAQTERARCETAEKCVCRPIITCQVWTRALSEHFRVRREAVCGLTGELVIGRFRYICAADWEGVDWFPLLAPLVWLVPSFDRECHRVFGGVGGVGSFCTHRPSVYKHGCVCLTGANQQKRIRALCVSCLLFFLFVFLSLSLFFSLFFVARYVIVGGNSLHGAETKQHQ